MRFIMSISQGFKPHIVRDVLDISQETLRYWRSNIDSDTIRTHFSPSDILVYRLLKIYTIDYGIPIKRLKHFDWSNLFSEFNKQSYSKLNKLVVVLNQSEDFLKLIKSEDAAYYSHYRNLKIDLETVVEENIKAILAKGENSKNPVIFLNDYLDYLTD